MHEFLFYNKFIIFLYMFRALCAYHQEVKIVLLEHLSLLYAPTCFEHYCAYQQDVKIVLYSIWYHHTL